jgi:hypothetical protein
MMVENVVMLKDRTDEKRRLRAQLYKASAYHSLREIAESVGCTPQSLSNFKQTGQLGAEYSRNLLRWLDKHGYTKDDQTAEAPKPYGDPSNIVANRLQALVDTLRDPDLPDSTKVRAFASEITLFHEELQPLIATLEKSLQNRTKEAS